MGLIPRSRRFKVVGIFKLGLNDFDSAYGFVALDTAGAAARQDAARPAGAPRRRHLRARPPSPTASPPISATEYLTQDWADMNRSLFSALSLEKMAISITIGLIVMVAALNIIASLVLLVMEKSRDIAILKTMGASARSIMTHLHAAGADHRRWSARLRGAALGYTLAYVARSLPADQGSDRRLPGLARAVHRAAAGTSPSSIASAIAHLLRRDAVSVTAGGAGWIRCRRCDLSNRAGYRPTGCSLQARRAPVARQAGSL